MESVVRQLAKRDPALCNAIALGEERTTAPLIKNVAENPQFATEITGGRGARAMSPQIPEDASFRAPWSGHSGELKVGLTVNCLSGRAKTLPAKMSAMRIQRFRQIALVNRGDTGRPFHAAVYAT